jgi:hypothetical protein
MVWFAAPETGLSRALHDFVAQTPIHKTMIVLCDTERDSNAASALTRKGARVASLNPIPESRERIFVAEGQPETVRAIRNLLEEEGRKLIELGEGAKPLYFAGVRFAAPLLLPWIAGAVEGLRAAGLSRAEAASVGEHIGIRTLRRYAKAGVRSWNSQTAARLRHALEHDLEAVRGRDSKLADLYEKGIRVALAKF